MQQITTRIEIAAPAEAVWRHLTDFAGYPEWNPFVRHIAGPLERGAQLQVTVQPDGGKPMSFKPTVLACEPGRELRWKGRLLMPGLFDGEHHFRIAAAPGGKVLFTHGEDFTGLLVPLVMQGRMRAATEAGFVAMNEALKRRAEGG